MIKTDDNQDDLMNNNQYNPVCKLAQVNDFVHSNCETGIFINLKI